MVTWSQADIDAHNARVKSGKLAVGKVDKGIIDSLLGELHEPLKKRVRQSRKPLMNKLESYFYNYLRGCEPEPESIYIQAFKLRLANGVTYTPDFMCLPDLIAYEVKGPWMTDDSVVKIKTAAVAFKQITFIMASRIEGRWETQRILP